MKLGRAAVFLSFAAAGCAQPAPPPLSIDPRVGVRPDAGVLVDTPLAVSTDGHGFTRVSIQLHNPNRTDLAVNCTADWFDDLGHPVSGLMGAPMRVAVPASGVEFCETVSPSPAARRFRVMVTPVF